MMKRVFALIVILLLMAYMGVALFYASNKHKEVLYSGMSISVNQVKMNSLIDTLTISRLIESRFGSFEGQLICAINTDTIVNYLKGLEQVKDAGVYFSQQGRMYITIEQHEPLFRVYPNGGAPYAIDEKGEVMPIRGSAAFRSIVVTGAVTKEMVKSQVVDLVEYINADRVWRAMFEQIHVEESGDYILVPNIANIKIRLGSLDEMDLKFENLRLYLEQGVDKRGWSAYKEINLKFTNQVVGVKR